MILSNYITTSWRHMMKNKLFSAINLFGLAIGLMSSMLIVLYTIISFLLRLLEKNMRRQIINLLTSIAFVICITPLSYAQGGSFFNNGPFANRNSAHAGIYLKIPFTGGLKYNKKEKLKFGASLSFTREYHTSNNPFSPSKQFTANLVDFKFDNKGFNALAISGQDILIPQDGRIVLSVGGDGKIKWGKVGLYSLAVIGGATIVLATQVCWTCD